MRSIKRLTAGLTLIALIALIALTAGITAPGAQASTKQQFLIQDDAALHTNLVGTLTTMRDLGATIVKLTVPWASIAPDPESHTMPKRFTASNPASYPGANWGFYDSVVSAAKTMGLRVGFMPTSPAPLWATASGAPKNSPYASSWEPSAADYGAFVQALGERYDGRYKPKGAKTALPRVSWWSIWNEPNFGPDLGPQAIDDDTVYTGADMYRQLLAHAWGALAKTGHTPSHDTILIGETAPRGVVGKNLPGNFAGTVPITFLQFLYCVNAEDQELTGKAATANGCPGKAATLRAENPALFDASGYAAHPYAQGVAPDVPTYACSLNFCWNPVTHKSSPGYADFAELPRLEALLKRVTGHTVQIWNTEFGYWTTPPDNTNNPIEKHEAVSPTTAALYMNWAEYLSYENPNVASYAQYLLTDPLDDPFSTGLVLHSGRMLATFAAYETPLFMPVTTSNAPSSLTVWGAIRPAQVVLTDTGLEPEAEIQFQAGSRGAFKTVKTVTITNPRGYFDVKVPFMRSGSVRIAWLEGTRTVTSRSQSITVK